MTIPRLMRLKNFYYCRARKFPLRLLWYDLDLSTIPEGTAFPHPYGITLNTAARWGQGCQVRQNVTLGNRWFPAARPRKPVVPCGTTPETVAAALRYVLDAPPRWDLLGHRGVQYVASVHGPDAVRRRILP